MKGSNSQEDVGKPEHKFELELEAWQVPGAEGTKARLTTLVHTPQTWPSATAGCQTCHTAAIQRALRQCRWGAGPCRHLTTSVIWAHSKNSLGRTWLQV